MKLKFIEITKTTNPILTVHKTGKLGFNKDAAELMALKKGDRIKIAIDEDDKNAIYFQKTSLLPDTILISKAGPYFYIKALPFDTQSGQAFTLSKVTDPVHGELFKLTTK